MRIKAFISYSAHDCDIKAGILKDLLQKYLGFDPFIAHVDIPVGRDFNEMIVKQIKECDVFFPLSSQSSENSLFVNQEIGIAIGSCKSIIPIKIDKNPFGFISHIQALKFPQSASEGENTTLKYVALATKIYYPLFQESSLLSLRKPLLESLLFSLSNSPSYFTSNVVGHFIFNSLKIDRFNNEYDHSIDQIIKNNSYVYRESYFIPQLINLLNCS